MNESLFILLSVLPYGIAIVFAIGLIGFLLSLWRKDNGIADVLYGWHFIMLAVVAELVSFSLASFFGGNPAYSLILTTLVLCWGLRLSWRIYRKNRGKPKDFRYAAWRAEWKWFKTRSLFQIYLLQGLIALVIAMPVALTIMLTPVKMNLPLALGIVIWLVGFIFEAVGDMQLDRFIKDPANKGKLMMSGLWSYSRHPNYFGESLAWWGLWVASLGVTGEIWYLTLISPLLITFLLLKVSGVPLLEARMSRHSDWAEYAKKTPVLVPWFPRK
jgi:steroid 5-alpha reductase family enzyme